MINIPDAGFSASGDESLIHVYLDILNVRGLPTVSSLVIDRLADVEAVYPQVFNLAWIVENDALGWGYQPNLSV